MKQINLALNLLPWLIIALLLAFTSWAPTLAFATASGWAIDRKTGDIVFDIEMWKLRSCTVVGGGAEAYIKTDGHGWSKAPIVTRDPASPHPLWSHFITRWSLTADPAPDFVLVRVQHICGGSVEKTDLGPFTIPKPLVVRGE